jgi:glycosyltransferase involved in cell wall biosynthesis
VRAEPRTLAVNGVFLTQRLTGVQRYARELCSALGAAAAGRWRIRIIAPQRRDARVALEPPAGTELIVDPTRLAAPLWTQVRLPWLVRRLGSPLLWSPANTGTLALRKQVVTIFDASFLARPEWFSRAFRAYYRLLIPRLARRVERVVTISEFSRIELAKHGVRRADRIDIVPCGVSRSFRVGADSRAWQAKRPYLLAVGSSDPRKNLGTLLEAWALLPRNRFPGMRLLVAGGESRVFARGSSGAVPDGVELLGAVPDELLPGLYAGAEALVYPSLYEGFGLPPLEAMACGTPAIVSRAASLPEVCGDAALYCDPADPRAIAERIEAVLSDSALRGRLRAAGLAHVTQFTWERAAARMLQILES